MSSYKMSGNPKRIQTNQTRKDIASIIGSPRNLHKSPTGVPQFPAFNSNLSMQDVRKAVHMFEKVRIPLMGIVENMSYFLCPHCGGRSEIFAHGGARHDAAQMGVPFLGEAPLDMKIRETSDSGRPVVGAEPDSPQAGVYLNLAAKVKTLLETQKQRKAPNILMG